MPTPDRGGEVLTGAQKNVLREFMKETVLDLLMYLFENHMEEEPHLPPEPLRMDLQQKLLAAGYESDEISRAFSWLDGASESPSLALANVVANMPKPSSFRIYTDEEQAEKHVAERPDVRFHLIARDVLEPQAGGDQ
ncbi:MAG: hypothetical protein B7Z82_05645, partial [Halothiobacillus sp. 20-54-6]